MTSLVTRCPACTTLFKVVPDQLRISEGWVRCGQCDEVFDAHANMQSPMSLSADGDQLTDTRVHPEDSGAQTSHGPVVGTVRDSAGQELQQAGLGHADGGRFALGSPEEPTQDPHDSGLRVEPSIESSLGRELPIEPQEPTPAADPAPTEDGVKYARPTFLSPESQPVRLSKRGGWASWVLALVTGGGLLAQIALFERDRLAAYQPAVRPLLESACASLGCKVAPLRRIDALVIESSSFVKVKADVYRLAFTVRNGAPTPLAVPSIELSLTDGQDQTMFRRVLNPLDFGVAVATVPASAELAVTVPLSFKPTAGLSDKVSGYRLLVFYP